LFVDDICDISEAGNEKRLNEVNQLFETAVLSRLNNLTHGRVVVVGHRVAKGDLTGHLLAHGGFEHYALPLIAERTQTLRVGDFKWRRPRGDVLNHGISVRDIQRKRRTMTTPSFDLLYQQRPEGSSVSIAERHFLYLDHSPEPGRPVVVSIDAALLPGERNSYTVAQAWVRSGDVDFLADQIRLQGYPAELARALRQFCVRHRPSIVLIEEAATGPFLAEDLEKAGWTVRRVKPGQRSKEARLIPHLSRIRRGCIALPRRADWTLGFVEEAVSFPRLSTDQIDAMTQYLDFIQSSPALPNPPPLGLAARGQPAQGPLPSSSLAATAFGSSRVPSGNLPGLFRARPLRR
jgi:predicted phage terminase large subunit-like protein